MAARSTSARRLRWLVLVGLAGAAVWVVRSRRAGSAGLLEQWPDTSSVRPPAVPMSSEPSSEPEPAGAPSDAATPPIGFAVPTAADAPDPDPSDVPSASEPSTPSAPVVTTAGPDRAIDPAPAEPLTGAKQLFTPPGSNGTEQAPAPTSTRPSPRPRQRSTTVPQLGVGSGAAAALPDGSAPGPEYTIKGNAGSMLFHRPDSPYYNRTKAEVWFRTATDARAAGFTEYSRNRTKDS